MPPASKICGQASLFSLHEGIDIRTIVVEVDSNDLQSPAVILVVCGLIRSGSPPSLRPLQLAQNTTAPACRDTAPCRPARLAVRFP